MIVQDEGEARALMVRRAAEGACVYCGDHLDVAIRTARGRICRACLPPGSDAAYRMAIPFHRNHRVEVPREIGDPHGGWTPKYKNSYWLIEQVFGSLPLLGGLTYGDAGDGAQ